MKKITKAVIGLVSIFYASSLFALIYIWQDEKGGYQISDSISQVPKELRALIGENPPDKKAEGGIGYWRDDRGNFHFFRVAASVVEPEKIEQLEKTSYDPEKDIVLRGKPNPEVLTATVEKVLTPDTILLGNGKRLRYTGVAFPGELPRNCEIYNRAVEYERDLLEGKTVKILFDTRKEDKAGCMLGQVFLGTNIFVNADLVLKGYAQMKIEPPNLEYFKLYRKLENYARQKHLGIWKELNKTSP